MCEHNVVIGECCWDCADDASDEREARLRKALPLLVEALEQTYEWLTDRYDVDTHADGTRTESPSGGGAILDTIRAALAAARGVTP